MPFPNADYRFDKWDKHVVRQAEFAFAAPEDYEAAGDAFMAAAAVPGITWDCTRRSDGAHVRYSGTTQEFGIALTTGVLRAYYILNPAIHRESSNLAYFHKVCLS